MEENKKVVEAKDKEIKGLKDELQRNARVAEENANHRMEWLVAQSEREHDKTRKHTSAAVQASASSMLLSLAEDDRQRDAQHSRDRHRRTIGNLTLNLILAQLGTHKSRLVGTELWSSVSCGEAQKPDLILVFPQLGKPCLSRPAFS